MTRTYMVDAPVTMPDPDTLDAWTARDRIAKPLTAIYEGSYFDTTIVLTAYESVTSMSYCFGPVPFLMRFDRSGAWRTPNVDILACYGTTPYDMRGVITDTYHGPHGGYIGGAYMTWDGPDGSEPYVDWTELDSGTTLDWVKPDDINIPSGTPWSAEQYSFPSGGDERGLFRLAWLTIWPIKNGKTGPSDGRFGGIRINEIIEDES